MNSTEDAAEPCRVKTMANLDSRVTIHMVASLDGFIARKDGRDRPRARIAAKGGFAMARLPRIHLATALVLVATATLLAWANLQVSRAAEDFNHDVPPDVDPITRYFFYRGWPLSPCWFCPIRHMQFRADGFPLFLVLVLDLAVAQLALFAVARFCNWTIERLRRRRAQREAEGDAPSSGG